jgi:hypothetical protein
MEQYTCKEYTKLFLKLADIQPYSHDRKLGETTQRLFALSVWWEPPFFTDEEQAILRLAEQVTLISKE